MSQNPYQPSTGPSSSPDHRPANSFLSLCVVVGSIFLNLFGVVATGLSMFSSDASRFFLLTGTHLIACGAIAVTCVWVDRRSGIRHLLCWTSMIVNAVLIARITILILNGTVRGPLVMVALLLGLSAAVNIASAALNRRRIDIQTA